MIHVQPARRTGKSMHSALHRAIGVTRPLPRPMPPARYLRLRREACGVTINQLVEAMAPRLRDRAEARAIVELLETDGARARKRSTIQEIAIHLPIDVDTYFQLVSPSPDRHPRICHGCGHSDALEPRAWAGLNQCLPCAGGSQSAR